MPTVETTPETTTTTTPEANGKPAAKAPAKKKPAAKKTTKAPAKKAKAEKHPNAPKRTPMPDGKSVNATEPKREPHWNDRRVAVVKAMREMKATDPTSAKTAAEIAARASKKAPELKDRPDLVKVIGDVYRTAELVHNGFIKTVRLEGERELRYWLTPKGLKTDFPGYGE
jgi:hypothetical protein